MKYSDKMKFRIPRVNYYLKGYLKIDPNHNL